MDTMALTIACSPRAVLCAALLCVPAVARAEGAEPSSRERAEVDMANQRGSCLCGEVAYEIEGPFEHAHHCHCSYCRKFHGTPYATGALAPRRWLRGERSIARYESSPGFHRWFCSRCGSPLPVDPIGDTAST